MNGFKHESGAGFIKNIVIIVIVLAVVFFSQSAYFRPIGKNLFLQIKEKTGVYLVKAGDWLKAIVYPKISGEVAKRGVVVQEEINKQKNNILQNIWETIKNYFAIKFSKTFNVEVK